ncbi:saccharopine dehydrogenase family protein [Oceanicoccus sagamiensis]|uniref:Saccharopine dehydrogenase n=1 Tax=Oceanicoccus sagamiensis TaxID=716816 RepID=A0A1X9NK54_9GAMM|nr:saccharopine dehydrogenase NADP-binding domain-containing protein [Oceanicoccus sagamiensis]ARN75237.1 saccharopine dehydrogenase [Oceanicoccus sagamiensis]
MTDSEKFDLVVYGATGFTGRLICEHLNTSYGLNGEVNWAMAGRSQSKLEQVRDELGLDNSVALLVADTSDQTSVNKLVASTRVLISAVGPYQQYGSDVVKACAENGTDYVDLCGEPAWMHEMIGKYDELAKSNGARIVFSCGFDSIPFDMGVYFLQQAAQEKLGGPVPRIKCRVRDMNGMASGGTVASFMATMAAAKESPELVSILANPFALTGDFTGPEQPAGDKPIFEDDINSWSGPFIMATINTKNVHRSNFLLGHQYGEGLVYDEMVSMGSGKEPASLGEGMGFDMSLKPGEGPSKEQREAGYYDIVFYGTASDGQTIQASVKGDLDPGYGSTSKMIAEAGICLLQNTTTAGGCLTSAPAMGAALIERLQSKAGLVFALEQ